MDLPWKNDVTLYRFARDNEMLSLLLKNSCCQSNTGQDPLTAKNDCYYSVIIYNHVSFSFY